LRYFLDIAYKGTHYHGWQLQTNAHTVQAELESALQKIFRTKIETLACGRTDTGVHARQQMVHIDVPAAITPDQVYRLNRVLPFDISVNDFFPVVDTAHARFDALSRAYEYRITRKKDPFAKEQSWWLDRPLEVALMNEAAQILLKHHNFESFSKVHTDVKNFLCTIHKAEWRLENNLLLFEIEANRFLRGMVRAIVGTLVLVGLQKITVQDFEAVILASDRGKAGAAAPPEGLFLTGVKYPDDIFIAS
jgi:tRNA pseudouridine38-40 synthase